ncbi:MAG: phosphoglycerate mutase, partial [Acidobacteria bacterium ACB2]|nr:phosphoglycerate mutase [Acidobacteria bacterium ACB2]
MTTRPTRAGALAALALLATSGALAQDASPTPSTLEEKVRALENWDARILAGLVGGLDALGEWRLLLLPDHATPLALRTHTPDPVPYLLVDS